MAFEEYSGEVIPIDGGQFEEYTGEVIKTSSGGAGRGYVNPTNEYHAPDNSGLTENAKIAKSMSVPEAIVERSLQKAKDETLAWAKKNGINDDDRIGSLYQQKAQQYLEENALRHKLDFSGITDTLTGLKASDALATWGTGSGSLIRGLGELVGSDTLRNAGNAATEYYADMYSDALKNDLSPTAGVIKSVGESSPGMALGLGAGALMAKGGAMVMGATNLGRNAAIASEIAGSVGAKAPMAARIAMAAPQAAGLALGESSVSALSGADQAAQEFDAALKEKGSAYLLETERGKELLAEYGDKSSALTALRNEAINQGAALQAAGTAVGSLLVPGMDARVIGKVLGKEASITGKGLADKAVNVGRESFQEFIQGYGEQVGANVAAQQTFDPSRSTTEGAELNASMSAIAGAIHSGVPAMAAHSYETALQLKTQVGALKIGASQSVDEATQAFSEATSATPRTTPSVPVGSNLTPASAGIVSDPVGEAATNPASDTTSAVGDATGQPEPSSNALIGTQQSTNIGDTAYQGESFASDPLLETASAVTTKSEPVTTGQSSTTPFSYEHRPDGTVKLFGDPEKIKAQFPGEQIITQKDGVLFGRSRAAEVLTAVSPESIGVHSKASAEMSAKQTGGDVVSMDDGTYTVAPPETKQTIREDKDDARVLTELNAASPAGTSVEQIKPADVLSNWDANDAGGIAKASEAVRSFEYISRVVKAAFGWKPVSVRGLNSYGVAYGGKQFIDIEELAKHGKNAPALMAVHTIGHESTHLLERSNDAQDKADYQKLREVALKWHKKPTLAKRIAEEQQALPNVSAEEHASRGEAEVVADVSGAMWSDHQFWGMLHDIDNGSTMRRVAYRFMQAATRFLKAARGTRADVNTHIYAQGIEEVRRVAAEVWASRAMRNDKKAMPVSKARIELFDTPPQYARTEDGRGVIGEVAPHPGNESGDAEMQDRASLTKHWNSMSEQDKRSATRTIGNKVLDQAQHITGQKGWSIDFSSGTFEGQQNPNFILQAPESATDADIDEMTRIVGYMLDQKAMVSFDESNTTGDNLASFVKIELPAGMTSDTITELRQHLREHGFDGDTLRDGGLYFGNFTGYTDSPVSDADFKAGIERALVSFDHDGEGAVATLMRFQSGYMEPENRDGYLKGTHYESNVERAEAGGDILRRRQGRDTLERVSQEIAAQRKRWTDQSPAGRADASDAARRARELVARTGAEVDYGRATEGSVVAVGHHFSQQRRASLSSSYYGLGLKGAEGDRLSDDGASDIRNRIYFYVDKGNGITPEAGVGGAEHTVRLNNLYDANADTLGIWKNAKGDTPALRLNAQERAVVEAGFDGYLADTGANQDFAVLVGKHDIPMDRAPQYSRIDDAGASAEDIDRLNSLGSFDIDADYANDLYGLEVKEKDLSEEDMAKIEAELFGSIAPNSEVHPVSKRPTTVDYAKTDAKAIKQSGLFAEKAYPDIQYGETKEIDYGMFGNEGHVTVGGKTYKIRLTPDGHSRTQHFPMSAYDELAQDLQYGKAFSDLKLTPYQAREWNKRNMAAIDLYSRRHDLYTSIPADARKRILDTWKSIADAPGAFSFNKEIDSTGSNTIEKIQSVANSLLKGSKYKASIQKMGHGWVDIELRDDKGNVGVGQMEYVATRSGSYFTLHAQHFNQGSSMGKPFYQIAQAAADALNVPIKADAQGLLGVNNYRRTEQQMSSAARTGKTMTEPGSGQRIYGWNYKPKNQEQHDRNFVRLALAGARNVAEFYPEIQDLRYDLSTDKFTTKTGESAEADVKLALAKRDLREMSMSRSTLARAAITFEAMDHEVNVPDAINEPVLYSRKESELSEWVDAVSNGARRVEPGFVVADAPHQALQMFGVGRSAAVVLRAEMVRHLMNKGRLNSGISADEMSRLPSLIANPRAVIERVENGEKSYAMILNDRNEGGAPLLIALKRDSISHGKQSIGITDIRSMYHKDASLGYVLREIKNGNRVWMPEKEIARVRDFTGKGLIPYGTDGAASPRTSDASASSTAPSSKKVSQATPTNVFSDRALVKSKQGGKEWSLLKERVDISDADVSRAGGVAFSRLEPQTETPEFKRWFGDSKVVDADGKPLVVYHGTASNIYEFKGAVGSAGHFAFDPDVADAYAEGRAAGGVEGAVMYPAYLRASNIFDARNEAHRSQVGLRVAGSLGYDDLERIVSKIKSAGFDSYYDFNYIPAGGLDSAEPQGIAVFSPTQIKSAIGNNGQFDPENPDIRYSRKEVMGDTGRKYTPEQLKSFDRVGFRTENPTWLEAQKQRAERFLASYKQGIFDQFQPIEEISKEAYNLMRLSKGASGAFETLLNGGMLKLTDQVYDFDADNKGGVVERLLVPLNGEHHDFMRWVAANRAERLLKLGKENLFTRADIDAIKSLSDGETDFDYTLKHGPKQGQTTRNRLDIYKDSLIEFNKFNKNVMDLAEESGLIDPEGRSVWEHEFYVPFYRVTAEEGFSGAKLKSGVVKQKAFQSLKGGKDKLNADLLDNTLMNWAHLLDASAKNRAAKAALEAAVDMGVAIEAPESAVLKQMAKAMDISKRNVVYYLDEGQERYYLVEDKPVLDALTSVQYAGMNNGIMNALSTAKHWLTVGVTASPFFKIRNLIRDSLQAVAISNLSYNPLSNVRNGFALTNRSGDMHWRLLAGGGTIHFGTMLEGSEGARVQALVEAGVPADSILDSPHKIRAFIRHFIEPAVTAYNEIGNRGEEINRAALYDQLIKQGVSHQEASLQARDLMDFSMGGTWTGIRFLSQVVPFFNARLQGMYKLGRGAAENPARFSAVLMATAMASLALLAAYKDDEDWKEREEWDRNNFWWFKVGGKAFRIPKPFEIGAIATLAERGAELWFDKEMTAKRYGSEVAFELIWNSLAMNPTPQLIKPVVDLYANRDSFSGRPIENLSQERLDPSRRYTESTSMFARGASEGMEAVAGDKALSPVQIDHLIRGYFGWLGTFIVGAGDIIARPATGQPVKPTPDYWKVATGGMIADKDSGSSRYVTQVYEQAKELEQAYATFRDLQKRSPSEAADYAKDNAEKLSKYKRVEGIKQAEGRIGERIRAIERSNMSAEQKRDLIRQLQEQRNQVAKSLR